MIKRFLALLLSVALLVSCAAHSAPVLITQPPSVINSIGRLVMHTPDGEGVCTAFSIAPRLYLTAAHCVEDDYGRQWGWLEIEKQTVQAVKVNSWVDLALLAGGPTKPSLHLRLFPLKIGEHVVAAGFAGGAITYRISFHKVFQLQQVIYGNSYPGTIFLGLMYVGMSGGPIVDKGGEVVGVIQRGVVEDGVEIKGYGVDTQAVTQFLYNN